MIASAKRKEKRQRRAKIPKKRNTVKRRKSNRSDLSLPPVFAVLIGERCQGKRRRNDDWLVSALSSKTTLPKLCLFHGSTGAFTCQFPSPPPVQEDDKRTDAKRKNAFCCDTRNCLDKLARALPCIRAGVEFSETAGPEGPRCHVESLLCLVRCYTRLRQVQEKETKGP